MIKLLDCTLRDGGYINNWEFGYSAILDMIKELENTGIDILELGFLKEEPYITDRSVFNNIAQITPLMPHKKGKIEYAAMIEVVNPISLEKLQPRTEECIDIIRVIVWKTKYDEHGDVVDALQEGFDYCKGIRERGYKLCIQPARVDQYSDTEFTAMLNLFQQLDPMAIYVVDSWGTQNTEQIMHYVELAHKTLKKEIALGYHGHNNLMQAFGTASAFVHSQLERELIVDGSVYGIGRGAGNLNLELFAKYMNETEGKNYDTMPMISIYQKYIEKIYQKHAWGYCIPYFLTAKYNCNPNYGEYFGMTRKITPDKLERILCVLSPEDKIRYSINKAEKYLSQVLSEV